MHVCWGNFFDLMLINNHLSDGAVEHCATATGHVPSQHDIIILAFRPAVLAHSLIVSWLSWFMLAVSAFRSVMSTVRMRMKVEFIRSRCPRFFTCVEPTRRTLSVAVSGVYAIDISPMLWLTPPVIVLSCRRLIMRGRQLPVELILLRGLPPPCLSLCSK